MTRPLALALLLVNVWATAAGAWGADGHRVIGEIAWQSLDPATRDKVKTLLPQGRYQTLSEAGVWADREARGKKAYAWLQPLHYIDLDPKATQVVVDSINCPNGNCVIEAIPRFARVLEESNSTRDARIEAVRLLAHFIGDVHQPLHVAFADTCGGCTVHLQTPGGRMTLHELWDVELLKEDLRRRYDNPEAPEQSDEDILTKDVTPHWRLLARELVRTETNKIERIETKNGTSTDWNTEAVPPDIDVRAWAAESLRLSQMSLFHVSGDISDAYVDQAIPVMEKRLREAGVRLAAVLQEVFSDQRLFSKGAP